MGLYSLCFMFSNMNCGLRFSVVICTYSIDRFGDLLEAIESVKKQRFCNVETVIVVDGNRALYELIIKTGIHDDRIHTHIHLNERNLGLSKSRNIGAEIATGDVVAFLDDDAVAEPEWIARLAELYTRNSAVAAGGKLKPRWVNGAANFIPEEFWWLVGANPKGDPDRIMEVRNTYGSNISFNRGVFIQVGGFSTEFGFNAGKKTVLQGEEADLCNRIKKLTGASVWYDPEAVVFHKVFKSRVALKALFRRAFWQGYSKRAMAEKTSESLGQEYGVLGYILFTGIPERILQLFFLIAFTGTVGLGYLYRRLGGK